ncbi:MAG: hypothetical protein RSD14_06040 [Clostridia bacterium]
MCIKEFDYYTYLKLIKEFDDSVHIYQCSKNKYLFKQIIDSKKIVLSNEIISKLNDSNLKDYVDKLYDLLSLNSIEIIPIYSEKYPINLLQMYMPPLAIFAFGNIELLNTKLPKIYSYFNKSFSYYGLKVYTAFTNYILEKNCINVIHLKEKHEDLKIFDKYLTNNARSYNPKDTKSFNMFCVKCSIENICDFVKYISFQKDEVLKNIDISKNIFIFDLNTEEIVPAIIDTLFIAEAAYKKEIFVISQLALEQGKNILVVPGNIYTTTSYFSNYLIKEGANVLLCKYHLDEFLK